MARKDALLRLHQFLLARRDTLRQTLIEEIEDLRDTPQSVTGDSADAASDAAHHAVSSELAEIESRELKQVGQALEKIRQGTYGVCEGCSKKIPLPRLNALPYTSLCIDCQRKEETQGAGNADSPADWDKVYDIERNQRDDQFRLSDIELDLSGSGR